MDIERANEIMALDPVFFREREYDCQRTCMCWGLECGDGWAAALEEFARKTAVLNTMLRPFNRCVVGKQVKSKWADLRIYWDCELLDPDGKEELSDAEQSGVDVIVSMMDDIINEAERRCANTCEICGYEGSGWNYDILTCGSWLTHKCRKCAQERQRSDGVVTDYWDGFEFLSPFCEGEVHYGEEKYGCFIGLYYSMLYPDKARWFRPMHSSKEVQNIAVEMGLPREDDEALSVMKKALEVKFSDERMKRMLLDTAPLRIDGVNHSHENFWGRCSCLKCSDIGHKSHYGRLLMELRDRLGGEA